MAGLSKVSPEAIARTACTSSAGRTSLIFGMSDAEWESASLTGALSSGRPAAATVG